MATTLNLDKYHRKTNTLKGRTKSLRSQFNAAGAQKLWPGVRQKAYKMDRSVTSATSKASKRMSAIASKAAQTLASRGKSGVGASSLESTAAEAIKRLQEQVELLGERINEIQAKAQNPIEAIGEKAGGSASDAANAVSSAIDQETKASFDAIQQTALDAAMQFVNASLDEAKAASDKAGEYTGKGSQKRIADSVLKASTGRLQEVLGLMEKGTYHGAWSKVEVTKELQARGAR